MRQRILAAIVSFIVLGAVVAGCGQGGQGGQAPAAGQTAQPAAEAPKEVTVKVGVIGARTGPAAELGSYLDGALAAFKFLNDQGGVKSQDGKTVYKFESVLRDDEANPAKGKELTEELIQKEKVVAVIGPTNTTNGLQMIPVVFENKVPLISPVATGTVLMTTATKQAGSGQNYFFRTTTPDASQAGKMAAYVKAKGFQKIAVLHDNTAYGKGGLAELTAAFKAAGVPDPVLVREFNLSSPDLTPQVQAVKESGAEILVSWALGHDQAQIAKARQKLDLMKLPQLGSTALQQANFRQLAGPAADGALSIWPRSHVRPPLDGGSVAPRMQKAYDAYKKYFPQGMPLEQWGSAAFAWDAAIMVGNAVAAAGTDTVKLRDAIETLEHKNIASKDVLKYTKDQHEVWFPQDFAIILVKGQELVETRD